MINILRLILNSISVFIYLSIFQLVINKVYFYSTNTNLSYISKENILLVSLGVILFLILISLLPPLEYLRAKKLFARKMVEGELEIIQAALKKISPTLDASKFNFYIHKLDVGGQALGIKSIAINKNQLSYKNGFLIPLLAHEIGHLKNKDSMIDEFNLYMNLPISIIRNLYNFMIKFAKSVMTFPLLPKIIGAVLVLLVRFIFVHLTLFDFIDKYTFKKIDLVLIKRSEFKADKFVIKNGLKGLHLDRLKKISESKLESKYNFKIKVTADERIQYAMNISV